MTIFRRAQRSVYRPAALAVSGLPAPLPLTPRERDVVRLIGAGLEIKEIAAELGIGYHTAKMHIAGAKGKLGVRNQLEIAILMHGGRPRSLLALQAKPLAPQASPAGGRVRRGA